MSERFPLVSLAVPGTGSPVDGTAAITLSERRPGTIADIAIWDEATDIAATLGIFAMPAPGGVVAGPGLICLSTAPGRMTAIAQAADLADRLDVEISLDEGTVVDQTHGRAGLRISGDPAATLIQKGVSFDISRFAPMSATNAGIHHMGATIIRLADDTFDVFATTSLANSLWDWVTDAAVEHGWRVGVSVP